ncbi:MAG: phosphoglycerate mutase [Alphaproteobacteria bacterium]|nr:MAG: phosphoglycerate mutase [Alphaproteobacteria bacterium]
MPRQALPPGIRCGPWPPRGHQDAFWLGRILKDRDLLPDHILCSTATRTRETLDHLLSAAESSPATSFQADLYLAPSRHMMRMLQNLDTTITAPMIVGHNPGICQLFQDLVHNPPQDERSLKYPPGMMTIMDFDITDWSQLKSHTGQLFDMIMSLDK